MADAVSTVDAIAKDGGSPVVVGNPDDWQLMAKFVSSDKTMAISTKGMVVEGKGVLVATYRKEAGCVSETSEFVEGAKLVDGPNGGRTLVSI